MSDMPTHHDPPTTIERKAEFFDTVSRISAKSLLVLTFATAIVVLLIRSNEENLRGLMPHGVCLLWKPWLLWSHVGLDIAIGLSYVAISTMLVVVVRKFWEDIKFHWIFVSFALFIITCGFTHFIGAITYFYPLYYTEGGIKLITAVASVMTAVLMPGVLPKLRQVIGRMHEKQEEADRRADRMNHQLRIANHAKDEFLAIVSHELRTPMTAVTGWVQLMNKMIEEDGEYINPVLLEGFKQIQISCDTQKRIIEDLLDMSRVTLGQFSMRMLPVEIKKLVDETVESIRPAFDAKGINLVYTAEGEGFVQGDPIRLRQVLWNLLYNALKFTDTGSVYVKLDEHRNYSRIIIRDTGRGIPVEALPTIFEKLNKASGPPSAHGGGLGLGLSLTQTIVDLHAGHLFAESEGEGHGATFTLMLPQV